MALGLEGDVPQVAVQSVIKDSPAEKAGMKAGDVIVAFDGHPVTSSDQLGTLIHAHRPGDRATVTVVEPNGRRKTFTVTLGVNPVP